MKYGVLLFLWILIPETLFPHGVEVSNITAETSGAVQTVYFKYSTGEPMMYAKIRLYPPATPDIEILQSITDRGGYFSFVPDESGEWRITAEDGMGHQGEITVAAGNEQSSEHKDPAGGSGGKLPVPLAAVLGISLILNGFGFWYVAGIKKKGKTHAH